MKKNRNENNNQKVLDKLLKINNGLSGQDKEKEEMISKNNSEPRDRRKPSKIPTIIVDKMWLSEGPLKTKKSYELKACNNYIHASFENFKLTPEGSIVTLTREEVYSFLEDLNKVYGKAFPE
jgi:hypothetical protein